MRVLTSATTLTGMATAAKLAETGFAVTAAEDGAMVLEALDLLSRPIVVLESDLPDMDWRDVLSTLRAQSQDMTILALNLQKTRDITRDAFQSGADHVIDPETPPEELGARVRSIVARRAGFSEPVISMGALCLDLVERRAFWQDKDLRLSPSHFTILQSVCLAAPFVVSKQVIQAELYGLEDGCDLRSIDVFLTQLRTRLKAAGAPRDLIETCRGRGYHMNAASPVEDPGSSGDAVRTELRQARVA